MGSPPSRWVPGSVGRSHSQLVKSLTHCGTGTPADRRAAGGREREET